jgi:PAS domain S-box-containing protein
MEQLDQQVQRELSALREEVSTLRSEKEDLETLLELTTEYSDYVAVDLKDKVRTTQRESEERFRTIVETTPVPVIISRLCDGSIMYANTRASSLIGLSREALLRSQALDFYRDPNDRQELLKQLEENSDVDDYEMEMKRIDGTYVWITISLQLMTYKGVPSLLSAWHDITERKQAEELLADYNRLLEQQVAERTAELLAALDNIKTGQFCYHASHRGRLR